ncbi:hypothetical protein JOF56_005868 [Kibdelosporangium banguiense]|uniref:Methyl-accepting transducer domain-containing protein n=1 Tax=Kibdelosporangium banguiense TaxID=1365924 RepID=A0ABS4TM42_9PSEU|nr:hypothetical protein [Kibdelosporangium banguiense]MBP2325483.1 hypothetical protein [Kibdelosporangium banguiense]
MARRPAWQALLLLVVLSVFAAGAVQPVVAAPANLTAAEEPPGPRPIPKTPYPGWDGQSGVGEPLNQQLRWLVMENAEKSEDFEIRDVALAALAENTNAAFRRFLVTDRPAAAARAKTRREATARQNRATIEALDGTGGPVFNAEVDRVLAGTDYDREIFLLYGKTIATERDDRARRAAEARADELRARVTVLAATAGPDVQRAAQEALAAGDAAIAAFLNGGYLDAAKRDAVAREQYLKDLEERTKAAEKLSEVAKRAARASEARKNLLIAHGQGVRALQRSANAMVSASNAARQAAQILAANEAGGHHSPESFRPAQEEVNRQLGYARAAATDARNAAVAAKTQADILIEIELPYGADWARMAEGMGAAARAAELATETAQQAIVATMATDAARDDQAKAEARAEQARRWRTHGEEHARATAALAEAARLHEVAGKDAANRTRSARESAQQAERLASFHADEARRQMETAEREQAQAAECRRTAEAERAKAEQYRRQAEAEAVTARNARAEAERKASIAAEYERRAVAQERISADALAATLREERNAEIARDHALAAEREKDIAEAKAQMYEHAEAYARGTEHEAAAHAAAVQARADARGASAAAFDARNAANAANGAAARSREYAILADGAAARARAAAQEASLHAARASEAASNAESAAAQTHYAATKANAAAADATAAEAQAAHHSREATRLAELATVQATAAALASDRSRDEADAANHEAVSAVTQSALAGRAALGARFSSAAILEPTNTAIIVVAPFTGSDLDADWIAEVARQAQGVGEQQAKAAQDRANEARDAAILAQWAADQAEGDAKAAYQASANAAKSAANAQQSAANAQKSAADAAVDGAKAREAAAAANRHDAAAHESAARARRAANQANEDAAIAGRSADQAAQDAIAANAAAQQAERDAAAANTAAEAAERSAAAAQAAAEQAQRNADAATASMERARQTGIEIQQALDRLEQQRLQQEAERRKSEAQQIASCVPGITSDDVELMESTDEGVAALGEYREIMQGCANGGSVTSFLFSIGAEVLLEVIGWRDLERCFGDGDVAACIWTIINVLSFAVIVIKAIPIANAIVKVVANIGKYLAKSERIKNILAKFTIVLEKLRKVCPIRGAASAAAWLSPCDLLPNKASPEEIAEELAAARRLGVSPIKGRTPEFDALVESEVPIKWAVLKDGTVRVIPKFKNGEELKHTVLGGGDSVASAGECVIRKKPDGSYEGVSLDLNSGHHQPPRQGSLGRKYWEIGRNAFIDIGILFSRMPSRAGAQSPVGTVK